MKNKEVEKDCSCIGCKYLKLQLNKKCEQINCHKHNIYMYTSKFCYICKLNCYLRGDNIK